MVTFSLNRELILCHIKLADFLNLHSMSVVGMIMYNTFSQSRLLMCPKLLCYSPDQLPVDLNLIIVFDTKLTTFMCIFSQWRCQMGKRGFSPYTSAPIAARSSCAAAL